MSRITCDITFVTKMTTLKGKHCYSSCQSSWATVQGSIIKLLTIVSYKTACCKENTSTYVQYGSCIIFLSKALDMVKTGDRQQEKCGSKTTGPTPSPVDPTSCCQIKDLIYIEMFSTILTNQYLFFPFQHYLWYSWAIFMDQLRSDIRSHSLYKTVFILPSMAQIVLFPLIQSFTKPLFKWNYQNILIYAFFFYNWKEIINFWFNKIFNESVLLWTNIH